MRLNRGENMNQNNNEELMHYGVPGMRWGRRRAQRLLAKASNARQSAKEWNQIGNHKANKYKTLAKKHHDNEWNEIARAKQSKYNNYAKKDLAKAKKLEAKAKKLEAKVSKAEKGKAAVEKAKAAYKVAKKQYNKDFNKSSTLIGAWGPGNKERHQKTYESALAAERARKAYKAAKKKYR